MSNKNICVVGAGYWGKNHIRTLHKLGALGGIVDSNKNALDRFKVEYPTVNCFLSLDDALEDRHFLGFTVATPAETHYKIAKKIIENSKHVLVEKPLALNIDNAKELVQLANLNGVNLMVGHLLLFHPAIIKIKKMISDGAIGNLKYLYSNRLNLGKVRTEENVIWSLAPHDISIFQLLTEKFPQRIIANGSSILQENIQDTVITYLKYGGGIEGHIFTSWLHPFKEHRLVLIGSEGMITFDDTLLSKSLTLHLKKINMEHGIPKIFDGPVEEIDYEKDAMPLTEELRYFSKHLDGTPIENANANHALDVIKILVETSKQLENYG